MQKWHFVTGSPRRRDDVGEFALFTEQLVEPSMHASRFDDNHASARYFVQQRGGLGNEETHPPFHPVKELPVRQTVEGGFGPRRATREFLGPFARDCSRQPLTGR